MNNTSKRIHWSIWLARLTLFLGIASVAVALIGALGAGADIWSKMAGMKGLTWGFYLGVAALVVGLYTLLRYMKAGSRVIMVALAGMVLAGGYVGYIGTQIAKARSVPAIHDVTTNLDNPPTFAVLEMRKDNLRGVPGDKDPEFRGLDALERWQKMHRDAYGDIRPLTIRAPQADVMAKAEGLVKKRGWDIAAVDVAQGRIEATDTVALLKFKDDMVLRIIPAARDGETVVDMRSISRIGQSDLGVNARRVREFMADLKAQFPQSR